MRSARQKDSTEGFDEKDELIAYLDNATIVNACSILANPKKFDIYKLLDLDSFFEAFLFHDRVRTLVGRSFSLGFSGRYKDREDEHWGRESKDLERAIWVSYENPESAVAKLTSERTAYETKDLYRDLIGAGILRPVVRSARSVHYYVENHKKLDAIANSIDVDKTVSLLNRVFDGGIPWDYRISDHAYQGEWNVEKQAFDKVAKSVAANLIATNNIVFGEETWISELLPRLRLSGHVRRRANSIQQAG